MSSSPKLTPPRFTPPTNLPQRIFEDPLVDPKTGHLKSWAWKQFFQKVGAPVNVPTQTVGTHAERLKLEASKVVASSIFVESDRGLYYIAQNSVWRFLGGVMQVTQANLPKDLTASDVGVLVTVTDYNHSLQWTGTGWTWGPGDAHSGYVVAFVNAPPDDGWAPADGSAGVSQLLSDGTVDSVTVPNVAGSYFRQ